MRTIRLPKRRPKHFEQPSKNRKNKIRPHARKDTRNHRLTIKGTKLGQENNPGTAKRNQKYQRRSPT